MLPNLLEQRRELGLMPVHIRTIAIPVDTPYPGFTGGIAGYGVDLTEWT
jgi:hypothetical protein